MPQRDPARLIKDALAGWFTGPGPDATATLEVDDDYRPTAGNLTLLVADDGGPKINDGPWNLRTSMARITIRLTAFGNGRDITRNLVIDAADWLCENKPAGISRFESVSPPLETRDRATGARLASITMPALIKPV